MFRNKLFENKGASMAQERADLEKPHYLRSHSKFINEAVKIEKMRNTPGSTAGAGSGDYHAYRIERRKERYRLAKLDWDANQQREKEQMDSLRSARFLEASNRTLKKALRRMKKRDKKKAFKKAKQLENTEKEDQRAHKSEQEEDEKSEDSDQENISEQSKYPNHKNQGEREEVKSQKSIPIQKCELHVQEETRRDEGGEVVTEGEIKIVVDSD